MFHYVLPVTLEENVAFETLPRTKTNDIFDFKFVFLF